MSVGYRLVDEKGIGFGSITQTVSYDEFVDGESTAGTMTLKKTLPDYCFPIGVKVKVTTGFTGDTTCTLAVGTSTTALVAGVVDADILTTDSTLDIYTAGKTYMALATFSDGDVPQDDAQTGAGLYILLTATGASDWGNVSAGKLTITVYYMPTMPE